MTRSKNRFRTLRTTVACVISLGFLACQETTAPMEKSEKSTSAPVASNPSPGKATDSPPTQQELIARGRSLYNSNCIACHSPNPAQNGAIGPAIAGSSMALLEAKVIHNTYPPGYTPKRDSQAMIPLPHLASGIPALHAFLNASN